jgi:hypothetical protein
MGFALKKATHYIMNSILAIGIINKKQKIALRRNQNIPRYVTASEVMDFLIPSPNGNINYVSRRQVNDYLIYASKWLMDGEIDIGKGYKFDLSHETELELLETLMILNMNYDRPFLADTRDLVFQRGELDDRAISIVSALISSKNRRYITLFLFNDTQVNIEPKGFNMNSNEWSVVGFDGYHNLEIKIKDIKKYILPEVI